MGSLFVFRKMLSAFFVFYIVQISPVAVASVDSGVAWLKSQQRGDGGFSNVSSQATDYQATVEALLALHQLSSLENGAAQSGSEYLYSVSFGHLEEIANSHRLKKIKPALFPTTASQLTEYKSSSGGYGDYPGYEGAISTSAILAHAITAQDTQSSVNMQEVIAYLLAQQKADKGWAEESHRSSVYVTALVSRSLQVHRFNFNLSHQIASANEYLLSSQQVGGGWGTNLETAMALLAIIPATTSSSSYQKALDRLLASQSVNGSWNNDVYTTALALQVLGLIKNSPPIETPTSITITGNLISTGTNMPVQSAQIAIDGETSHVFATDVQGQFSIENILPGNYTLTFTAPGFQQVIQSQRVNAGDRINLGVISLNPLPTTALIRGQITDAITHLPLNDVVLQFSGSVNTQVITDQQGIYALELAPGAVSIVIAHSGYHSVSGTLNAGAGIHFVFSPSLYAMDIEPPTDIKLRGAVVDSVSGEALSGVNILVASNGVSVLSGAGGEFILSGLSEGGISVVIEKDGYQSLTFNGTAVANSIIDLGILNLTPQVANAKTLYGHVKDADTGVAIPNATINAVNQTIITDINGAYEINEIELESFVLTASVIDYQASSAQVSLTGNGRVKLDIPLKKLQVSNIAFKQLSSDKAAYSAFDTATINGVILNTGDVNEDIVIQAQIFNSQGIMIDEFAISNNLAAGSQPITVTAGGETSLAFPWFTQSYPPGQYRVMVSVYASEGAQMLDQRSLQLEVMPTAKIASLRLLPTPDHVNQGTTQQIQFQAALRNKSNVPVALNVSYHLKDPNGTILFTDQVPITIEPTQLFATVNLGMSEQLFSVSGAYTLAVVKVDSLQPELIEGGAINVIPDINITIEQAITPSVVVPGASERVRVKIRLEGTEVN